MSSNALKIGLKVGDNDPLRKLSSNKRVRRKSAVKKGEVNNLGLYLDISCGGSSGGNSSTNIYIRKRFKRG